MTTPKLSRQSIRWVCVNKKEMPEHTLQYTRKDSIAMLIRRSYTWKQAKKWGWRCIKVKLTIEEL